MQSGDEGPAAADSAAAADELAARVIALGRQGLGRAEIAAALDVGLAELARLEREDGALAAALARAADLERAWWEALPREALAAGARMNMGAWLGAMQWRFGAEGGAGAAPAKAAAAAKPQPPRTFYYLPDNFMERTLEDGTPITPAMRREMAIEKVQPFLARAEAKLAQAQEDLEHWREELRRVEARNYDPDAQDEWDEGGDGACDADDDEGDDNDRARDEQDDAGDGGGGERVAAQHAREAGEAG